MEHSLNKEEVGRYSRQLLVNDFGVKGQDRLKASRVLIVGAGGLGCPVATYLAGAGIGVIGIVDYDEVSLDNLHRQVAHKECNVGKLKTESLKESILGLNHTVQVNCHNVLLDRSNALEIVRDYDIVADCSDNAATRYLINDACVLVGRPLVSGSALRWEGQLTVYHHGETGPCYRCLFPCPPNASLVTNCSEGGVLGPIVGTIGSMQALEVIKLASGLPPSYAGRLFLLDGLSGRTRCVALRPRRVNCDVCGDEPTITKLIDYQVFCGAGPNDKTPSLRVLADSDRVTVEEYQGVRGSYSASDVLSLLDTRPPHEFAIAHLPEAINVTLDEMRKLDSDDIMKRMRGNGLTTQLFVICHRGNDSQLAVEILRDKLPSSLVIRDIKGGYQSWAEQIDNDFPLY